MEPTQVQQLIQRYLKAYNRFDVAGMLATLHDDVVFENVAGGEVNLVTRGKAEFQAQAEQAAGLFREREQQLSHLTFEGEQAHATIAYRGVLAVDLPNGMRAGEVLALEGKSVFTFRDELIAFIRDIS